MRNTLTLVVRYSVGYPDGVLKAEHVADVGFVIAVLIRPVQGILVVVGGNSNCYGVMDCVISHCVTS